MINYKSIGVEYLTGVIFGGLALVISLLLGFISGNRISLVFFRTIINALLFSGIGIGCAFIIKKFVPEVYRVFNSADNDENIEMKTEDIAGKENASSDSRLTNKATADIDDGSEPDMNLAQTHEDKELENEFNILDKQPSEFSTTAGIGNNDTDNITRGNVKNKSIKYEPKIAAQAIRTMMKKDE